MKHRSGVSWLIYRWKSYSRFGRSILNSRSVPCPFQHEDSAWFRTYSTDHSNRLHWYRERFTLLNNIVTDPTALLNPAWHVSLRSFIDRARFNSLHSRKFDWISIRWSEGSTDLKIIELARIKIRLISTSGYQVIWK